MPKKLLIAVFVICCMAFTSMCWADAAADKAAADLKAQIDEAVASGKSADQRWVANNYAIGHESIRDINKAIEWYEKAAAQNDVEAIKRLGNLYFFGDEEGEVKPDFVKAREWYEKGAALNDKWCASSLGDIYENGNGVEVNIAKAIEYFQLACDNKDSDGCEAVERLKAASAK